MESDTFSDVTWMPCLGRNFHLGDLYDCCTHEMVTASSIWDDKQINEAERPPNKTTDEDTYKKVPIEYATCVPHNIDKKAKLLGINGELYLSCATGHIKLGGEASFFNDIASSNNVVRMALKCYSSSKVIQLDKNKLNFVTIQTFEQEQATHVITGIQYGAISIIVCEQKLQGKHNIKAAHENLQAKIKYLKWCISGSCPEMLSNMESNSENITCKIFSTLHITCTIETYTDAVKFCKDLYKLHTNNSMHEQIRVSLVPLKNINENIFKKYSRGIKESDLINKVKDMNDVMDNMGLDLMDLQANVNTLPCIMKQIELYNKSNTNLQSEFTNILECTVPKYRKGEIEESVIKEKIEATFNKLEKLYNFVQNKLQEVHHISVFMNTVKDYELIPMVSDVYFKYEYIVCLEFNTSHFELQSANISPWYEDKIIIGETIYRIKQFLTFATKESSDTKAIKFAKSEFSDKKCDKLVVINLYHGEKRSSFEPPTPPSKPVESQKTESSITLTWSESQQGTQFISSYCIYFCKINDDNWMANPTMNSKNNTTTIENLEANTGYLFKVSATLTFGTIMESQVSEIIYTTKPYDTKAGKNAVEPTEAENMHSDDQGTGNNTAHSCSKGATATSNPKENIKTSENITSQEMKIHSQDTVRKPVNGTPNVPTANKSAKNIGPKKGFHDTNVWQLLNADTPRKYKLRITKRNKKPTGLEIFKFGNRNHQLPEKVILLVGATGAGKSTLINGMVNYIFGVEWEDSERAVLIENCTNEKDANQALSQTRSVQVYKISCSEHQQLSYNLSIIDTPGFADTDGINKDQTVQIKIQALLSDKKINHLDGIGFVVQAPLGRLSATQSYVMHSVCSLFSNDVANNIFVLVTFSDAISPPPVLSALAEASIQNNKMFKFNNSALYANTNEQDDTRCSLNKSLWEMGMKSFSTFFGELETIKPVTLTVTKELLIERKKLQCLVGELQKQANCEFRNMQTLKYNEQMLIKHKAEAKKNENFRYQEKITYTEILQLQSKSQLATNCHKCKVTCHYPCHEYYQYGCCNLMKYSPAFREYICSKCTCSTIAHEASNTTYHTHIGTETKINKSVKQQYDKARDAQVSIEKKITDTNSELRTIREIVHDKLLEMHICIQRINEISLQPNLNTEADYISSLIASEEAEQTEGYTIRVELYQKILQELENDHTTV